MTLPLSPDLLGRLRRALAMTLGVFTWLVLSLGLPAHAATRSFVAAPAMAASVSAQADTNDGSGERGGLPSAHADGAAVDAPDQAGDGRRLPVQPASSGRESGLSRLTRYPIVTPAEIGFELPERPPRG